MVEINSSNALVEAAVKEGISRLCVGAVVKEDNKVLLLRRPSDVFLGGLIELPGGEVDFGESLHDAVARELQEETNIKLKKIVDYLGHFDYLSRNNIRTRQFTFLVDILTPFEVKLTEHDSYYWISIDDLGSVNVSKEVYSILTLEA